MKIAYNALGESTAGKAIRGHVFFDSRTVNQGGQVTYAILAYHFLSENMVYTGPAAATDRIRIPLGPNGTTVAPGSASWAMGVWFNNTGVFFQAVDNAVFDQAQVPLSDYAHLPPRMELKCDFTSSGPFGPFHPKGWLKLIWDPQFAVTHGLKANFFDDIEN